nr:glycosyltransferase family A protein [uncultured Moraxella sp.]
MQALPTLDVIIPCYNAKETLIRAVGSVLSQVNVSKIILVNDGSTDDTARLIDTLATKYANILALHLPKNGGVAMARNWGVMHSTADLVAFLDADDAYEAQALSVVPSVFAFLPSLSLLRLKLVASGLATRYAQHDDFEKVWDIVQMTGAGNTVFRRNVFLLCGGFPTDSLFRTFGGEDGALGIALANTTQVGTLFEPNHQGVIHYCREGMHAQRLLDAYLFDKHDDAITETHLQYANQVTQRIMENIRCIAPVIDEKNIGRKPILIEYAV